MSTRVGGGGGAIGNYLIACFKKPIRKRSVLYGSAGSPELTASISAFIMVVASSQLQEGTRRD